MKKGFKLFSILTLIIMLSACGSNGSILSNEKTLTCTNVTTDEDGYKTDDEMKVTYKDDKVVKVVETNISETDPDILDFTYSITSALAEKFNKVDGMNIVYSKVDNNKIKFVLSVDYSKLNVDTIKETFGEIYDENSFYNNKDMTIEEFKKENLKDYTCK